MFTTLANEKLFQHFFIPFTSSEIFNKSVMYNYDFQEDAEEDDGDSVERVLWHQTMGIADEAAKNHRSTLPAVMSVASESEPLWNDVEFCIKWKGQSYLH